MVRREFILRFVPIFAAVALLLGSHPSVAQDKSLTVFAAASMKNALDDVNAAFTKATGIKVVPSYAASSALAKQIENGAPADVFVSADLQWMDYLAGKKAIKPETRSNLLGNKLVLIAPKDSKIGNVSIGQGFDLAKLAGDGRIATGDVKAVPVGLYAKAALEKLGAWAAAEPKFAMSDNVRAALLLVSRGEAASRLGTTDTEPDKPFLDLWLAIATPPAIGETLLGQRLYETELAKLGPEDDLILIAASGLYSFKGTEWRRSGVFDRIELQHGRFVAAWSRCGGR